MIDVSSRRQIRRIGAARITLQVVVAYALCAASAHAQIVVDNTSSSAADSATLSFSHTINPGAGSLLMVGVAVHGQTKVTTVQWGMRSVNCSSTCTPATCLCTLSQLGTVADSAKNITVQLWALENPPPGSGNVIVTLPSSHRIVSGATSFWGVDHTTPLGKPVTAAADSGSPASVQVVNTPGGLAIDTIGASPNTTLMVMGSGQTQLYQGASNSSEGVSSAASTLSGTGAVTMSWSLGVPHWAMIAVPINAAPAAPTPPATTTLPTTSTPAPTATATPTPPPASGACVADCNGDGQVTVNEIIEMVDIALGNLVVSTCTIGDANGDGEITVNEIVAGVNNALDGCPASGS